jgi:hypothetical protein
MARTAPHWFGYLRALVRDDIGVWNLFLAVLYIALCIAVGWRIGMNL